MQKTKLTKAAKRRLDREFGAAFIEDAKDIPPELKAELLRLEAEHARHVAAGHRFAMVTKVHNMGGVAIPCLCGVWLDNEGKEVS